MSQFLKGIKIKIDNIFPNVDKTRIDGFYNKIDKNVKNCRTERGLSQLALAILIRHKTTSFYQIVRTIKIRSI